MNPIGSSEKMLKSKASSLALGLLTLVTAVLGESFWKQLRQLRTEETSLMQQEKSLDQEEKSLVQQVEQLRQEEEKLRQELEALKKKP